MLRIYNNDYQKILNHALKELPNEACGLIGGTIDQEVKVVREVYLLRNVDESREHFSMDPLEQLAAVKDLRKKGYQLFGNFHSHPDTPSRPSEEDKRLAYDSNASYLILSLQERERPVLKAFYIDGEMVGEEPIEFILQK
ncbi:M67 family metallopeptidase [Anaerocolumna xylanovorans]|uniref:Proteasome lid subunit RPN8/RPN11, contains Jab1/MPN metalloenzyme (JAMM) motif n=1 Tax=Anaerocolumna xylanovorans DSM 12503 TaxID=1121345 RepID=A0A1M7Y5F3_9FIRM|nr:M67 family metallopeptidase [Anaerocolumna xylanovorans]SHO47702.1 Proteasome lid subunit RPN8/RPN11, contains Jab1/MPN metalloenzyme (JAMM) motif [Anaerocolumna xylanovorans DSM 12503]